MDVRIGRFQRPRPDVLVIDADVADDNSRTSCAPAEVHPVVEVVSPESGFRDRKVEPERYASAGLIHFWRIEAEGDEPVVYVYEPDPATRLYAPTGIHHGRISVDAPFHAEIDLNDLLGRGGAAR
ncbi:hypothetical protein GCM10010466_48070 [Planomonospora alba]|uniref:Putative restriction endonuclease domain-containing protein n=2 Tax=Planomonospora alba TaxID=161354 RepID=A0ABP6NL16_9ACTN